MSDEPYNWDHSHGNEPPDNRFFHGTAERVGNMPFDPEDVKAVWVDVLSCVFISVGHDFDSSRVIEGIKYATQEKAEA
jgi:hypothetical protein